MWIALLSRSQGRGGCAPHFRCAPSGEWPRLRRWLVMVVAGPRRHDHSLPLRTASGITCTWQTVAIHPAYALLQGSEAARSSIPIPSAGQPPHWLAHARSRRTTCLMPEPAKHCQRGASLLLIGITSVDGVFDANQPVTLCDPDGPVGRACLLSSTHWRRLWRPSHRRCRPPWWCIAMRLCSMAAEHAYDPAAAPRRHALQHLDQGPAVG